MVLLTRFSVFSQVAVLAAAAASSHSSVRVTDPYLATQWNACPSACESANPYDWDFYSDLRILKSCTDPMLLNMVASSPTGPADPNHRQPLYACSTADVDKLAVSIFEDTSTPSTDTRRYSTKIVQMETAWREEETSQNSSQSHAEAAARLVQSHIDAPGSQNATIFMGYSKGVVFGAFIGSNMEKGKDKCIIESFLTKVRQGALDNKSSILMQVCDSDRSAAYTLGAVAESNTDPARALAAVRKALATWNTGACVSGYSGTSTSKMSVGEADEDNQDSVSHPRGNATSAHSHAHRRSHGKGLLSEQHHRRAGTCRTIQAKAGEGCSDLAARCGISPADFTKYNPSTALCSAGQHVCCSAGARPDFSPKPNDDGTCASYKVQTDDWCSKIAAAKSITIKDIETWNAKTWGWTGCDDVQAGGRNSHFD